MRNGFFTLLIITALLSCKNETKSADASAIEAEVLDNKNNTLTLLKGDFVFYNDAAVLQANNEIYGVFITEKMKELNKQAEAFKNAPTDMVQVEIKGKITNQKDDKILWENKLEIVEILNVKPIANKENNVVKLGAE
ncbi:hypothetical protein [Cognatitamlana onchidii]|uniref:hypothetical protein n=1 Tax=Cognatitamlana onchidii TaxID=2562860 RepID=UPI0010A67C91|nr:hypothetical protein [Algibacter onchidii]